MTKKVDSTKKARGEGTRRHKGEGTIYQRSDGKWCAQVSSGRDEHGKRLRRSVIGEYTRRCDQKEAGVGTCN